MVVTPALDCPSVHHVVSVLSDIAVAADLSAGIEAAALATLRQQAVAVPIELAIALVSPMEIRALNRTFRQVDEETDVLSFGAGEDTAAPEDGEAPSYLGDVAICLSRAEEQADEYGHSVAREVTYLTVHGVLHLLGHDHHDPEEQRRMRAMEEEVLAGLGLSRGL